MSLMAERNCRRRGPLGPIASLLSAALLGACATSPQPAEPATGAAPTEQESKDAMAALMAGEFALQDGRTASAAKHFTRAAALSEDPKVAEQATRVALAAKSWDLAREASGRWYALDPEAAGIRQAQIVLALAADDDARAMAVARKLIKHGDEGPKLVAQSALAAPTSEDAVGLLDALAADDDLPGGVDTLSLFVQVAQQLKEPSAALKIADRAVARHAADAAAWFWRGHAKLRLDDKAGARADFAKAVELAPAHRDYRLTYAALLDDLGDHLAAARALDVASADDDVLAARAAYAARADDQAELRATYAAVQRMPEPRPPARLELLGQLAELTRARDDALRWYREVPAGEHYHAAQLRIAVLLDDQGRHGAAIEQIDALRKAGIDDDERLAETFLLEAELYSRRSRNDEALAAYARGLQALPDQRRLLYARALLNENIDRVADAERDLRRIVALDPEDPDALNALGYTLADRTDRHDEAFALIEKALRQKPDEPAIIDSMGWVLYRKGQHAEALKHLRRAWELKPDAEVAAHLGEVLWVEGQRDAARQVWTEGGKLDAENETLRETRGRLER